MQGVLLVDKPSGWTSFDVVNYVRRAVARVQGTKPKNTKVGHTGTLDPLATGLLVLLIGKDYTRRSGDMSKHDKTYDVTLTLGQTSATGDSEGPLTPVSDVIPTEEAVRAALAKFTGDLLQTPPAFSAKKVGGVRAYQLARAGEQPVLEPRPVTIYANDFVDYNYPIVRFTSRVSSGTYIRSLAEDIGRELGSGAYMSALRRTSVGEYDLAEAMAPDDPELLSKIFQV